MGRKIAGSAPAAKASTQPSSAGPKKGMSAVFQEISSGKPVTAGLRKVTDDMKTKNRAERSGVVTVSEKESRTTSPALSKMGPPQLELQMGRKWVVENQIGRNNLVIDDCDAKQSVYIYGCKNSVLRIQGKVNNITIASALRWVLCSRLLWQLARLSIPVAWKCNVRALLLLLR